MIIHATASPGEIRVAAWDNQLIDYTIDRPGAPDDVGALYCARVIARVPSLAGAFLALPNTEGFLPDSQGAKTVTDGAYLTVRITRAAQGGKGPRLAAEPDQSPPGGPPRLLRQAPSAIERLAHLHPHAKIIIDDLPLLTQLRPILNDRLNYAPKGFPPEIAEAVEALASPQATLPGGASMTVTPTPALTAIDIDLAHATSARAPKNHAQTEANRALLPALAAQIRLRNLGGAIVVDLAGLSPRRRAALGSDFIAALAPDPLNPKFLGFSALGLAEILRPRIHPPLHERLSTPHAAALAALRAAATEIAHNPQTPLTLRISPAIDDALRHDPQAVASLTAQAGRQVHFHRDPTLPPTAWEFHA